MTREEQIKEYLKERNIPMDSLEANSIIEGIKWADKHPDYNYDGFSEEVLAHEVEFIDEWLDGHKTLPTFAEALEWERRRMIDKACSILYELNLEDLRDQGIRCRVIDVQAFKKAMEE